MKLSDLEQVTKIARDREALNIEAERLAARIKKNNAKLADHNVEPDDDLAITTN